MTPRILPFPPGFDEATRKCDTEKKKYNEGVESYENGKEDQTKREGRCLKRDLRSCDFQNLIQRSTGSGRVDGSPWRTA